MKYNARRRTDWKIAFRTTQPRVVIYGSLWAYFRGQKELKVFFFSQIWLEIALSKFK